jgi:putative transcriptional regulator
MRFVPPEPVPPAPEGFSSLRGRLLVASPKLQDGIFDRAVVLVLDHGDDGALGVVLNQPRELPVGALLPQWHDYAEEPRVVFTGGPVQPEAAIGLAWLRLADTPRSPGVAPLFSGLATVDLEQDPVDLAPLRAIRVFAGYSGWSPGQLDNEVALGAWWVVSARSADAFSDQPDSLWREVLRRQGGSLAFASTMPANPGLN